MKVTITILLRNARLSKALAKALEADNATSPSTVNVKTVAKRNLIATTITSKKNLETLIATMDDLLVCADAANKTLEDIENDKRA